MTETLRERVEDRLRALIAAHSFVDAKSSQNLIRHITREFRVQPVAVGKVTGEGEVEGV